MKGSVSRQWIFVILWSAFVVLLSSIPYIYGYLIAPAGRVFMGDARCFIDTNTYLAWMSQAADGHILFKDIYTTEPHARMFFHPLFLLLGNISRISHLSFVAVHGLARVLLGFMLLLISYLFVSFFIEDLFERSAAFIILSVSGGAYWLAYVERIGRLSEAWFLTGWFEGNTFLSIYSLPLFSASLIMLISTYILMLKAFDEDRPVFAVYSGILCLFLIFTHFFDALIVYPVLIAYIIAKYYFSADKAKLINDLKLFAIMFVISSGAAFFDLWVSLVNPVFGEHAWKGAITLSPGFFWYIAGLGFVGLAAVIGAAKVLFSDPQNELMFMRRLFIVVWVFTVPFLIYLPISFQRRLVEGAHIPISILAAIGVFWAAKRMKLNPKMVVLVFIIACLPSTIFVLSRDIDYLRNNSTARSMAGFLDRDIFDAMKWLRINTQRSDVVFCDYETGNYIPAVSGNVVFIGHSPQTLNFEAKWAATKAFFAGETDDRTRKDILKSAGAKYLFYGWKESSIGVFDPKKAGYLRPVFKNSGVIIYEVRP